MLTRQRLVERTINLNGAVGAVDMGRFGFWVNQPRQPFAIQSVCILAWASFSVSVFAINSMIKSGHKGGNLSC